MAGEGLLAAASGCAATVRSSGGREALGGRPARQVSVRGWIDPARGRVTFTTLAEEWQGSLQHLAVRSQETTRFLLDSYVLPVIGRLPIGAISAADVERVLTTNVARGIPLPRGSTKRESHWLRADQRGEHRVDHDAPDAHRVGSGGAGPARAEPCRIIRAGRVPVPEPHRRDRDEHERPGAVAVDGSPSSRRAGRDDAHDLRHTAASLLIAAGADVKAVQVILGHASATMTMDLYGTCSVMRRGGRCSGCLRFPTGRLRLGLPPATRRGARCDDRQRRNGSAWARETGTLAPHPGSPPAPVALRRRAAA